MKAYLARRLWWLARYAFGIALGWALWWAAVLTVGSLAQGVLV